MPTDHGHFQRNYEDMINKKYHYALTMGEWTADDPIMVRVHSGALPAMCLDHNVVIVAHSYRLRCKWQRRQRRSVIHEPRRAWHWHCQQVKSL